MNRKREEELMQLAFGDLRRENSPLHGQIETDPEAAKTYGTYCEMREGLKALKDIPEMQLSTERLRDAILKEGLSPRRESAWNWSWLATPLAVGACAFVVVVALRKPVADVPMAQGGSGVILEQPVAFGSGASESPFSLGTDFGESESKKASNVEASAPVKSVVSAPVEEKSRPIVRRNRVRRDTTVAVLEITPVPGLAKSLANAPVAPTLNERKQEMSFAAHDSAPAMFGGAENIAAPSSNEIVRIESKLDRESGAAKAVEVKGNQNVEIGG